MGPPGRLDDDLGEELKQLARKSGKPFRQVVNEAIRAGLRSAAPPARGYRLTPASLGGVVAGERALA